MEYFVLYLIIVSAISAIAVTIDKIAARNGSRRISEKSLMVLSVIGGGVAMYITMRIIHHKTRKNKFMVGIPVIVMLQLALTAIIYFNFFYKF
ncbi:MAG: DUF1294 domain-containing protein [Ruminococcaceae bacterium]|nr:DUF1294 domain-containing protein [Oscillospiraceae bacterium]